MKKLMIFILLIFSLSNISAQEVYKRYNKKTTFVKNNKTQVRTDILASFVAIKDMCSYTIVSDLREKISEVFIVVKEEEPEIKSVYKYTVVRVSDSKICSMYVDTNFLGISCSDTAVSYEKD